MTVLPRLTLLTLATLCLLATKLIFAQASTDNLTAQVGINICGNSIIESPAEDCEGLDLGGASCESLGYASGDLSCDIACTFDTSSCVAPTPTPTPSSTPTPTTSPAPTVSPTSQPQSDPSISAPIPLVTTAPVTTSTITPSPRLPVITELISTLPTTLASLLQSTGLPITESLPLSSLDIIMGTWVASWMHNGSDPAFTDRPLDIALVTPLSFPLPPTLPSCDINEDGVCDLTDFSVILFYFSR